jgi:hypothetical protein
VWALAGTRPRDNNEAFPEGYDAHWEGVDVGDHPPRQATDGFHRWEESWIEARRHDYDQSES